MSQQQNQLDKYATIRASATGQKLYGKPVQLAMRWEHLRWCGSQNRSYLTSTYKVYSDKGLIFQFVIHDRLM